MTELRNYRPTNPRHKRRAVPLSALRTSDAVKTVVNHPRRLDELVQMLEDKERVVRGRAAATIAQLSQSHPARLQRIVLRLRQGLADDSAYVRWHLIYALGKLAARFPTQLTEVMNDLAAGLDDSNRVVRMFACRALGSLAAQKPLMVERFFQGLKREIPATVARIIRNGKARKAPRS